MNIDEQDNPRPFPILTAWALLLITVAVAFAIMVSGCSTTIAPGADPVVVRAEQTLEIAADTVDAFIRWERANETKVSPEVHDIAETIRAEFPDKFRLTRAVLRAYKNNRSPEQKALLDAYLAALAEAVAQANQLKR
jgi:uncharacterized protein (UPF0335 family)